CFLTPFRPARCHLQTARRVLIVTRPRWTFIERHRDIASERSLNLDRELRTDEGGRAIDVILKMHAFLGDFSQFRQPEDLIAAAVGQNRPTPIHKTVESTEMSDYVKTRPNHKD